MNRVRRRIGAAVAALVLTLGGVLATSTSATAASGDSGYVLAFTPIYNCDWDACSYYEITQYNAWLPFQCWQDSPEYPYDRFFYIYTVGWVKASQVYDQPSLPHCGFN